MTMDSSLYKRFLNTRATTERLCKPLQTEDYVIQSMDDVSPPKWHLGHTSWFFETFLLKNYEKNYVPFHPKYDFIFNSYYESIGTRVQRPIRGLLSRPTVREVYEYRSAINDRMSQLFSTVNEHDRKNFDFLIELGIHHEQQHQELLYMDIKHILAINPIRPTYQQREKLKNASKVPSLKYVDFQGGIHTIGYKENGFCFDNELPAHEVLLQNFKLADRLITNGEYLEFMNDGGYTNPLLWLSDGWYAVNQNQWNAPMYWEQTSDGWEMMTLTGWRQVDPNEPVVHVSLYESDAFARWSGKRLPTEAEWEVAAIQSGASIQRGNFVEDGVFHPAQLDENPNGGMQQLFGDVWEWTSSAYHPYPGFKPAEGAIGEYNGKFMSNQMVSRGGACITPRSHIRTTYRNFFQPEKRWAFSGIRLASNS
jgi:ergothioneine biosynthesis protein EgtB